MQFADFSPPTFPSVAQQRDALKKGFGRAMQWAMIERLEDDPLLAACVCDQRFDSLIDEPRSDWQAAESAGDLSIRFRGWGMRAAASDLAIVLQHLWSAHDPKVISNLLTIFSNRSLPVFDARLIDLCQHRDPQVRRWAYNALKNNQHPLIREFTLSQLEKEACDRSVVSLFIKNYQRGDENRILNFVELPDDDCERHWLLMDVVKVLDKNPGADGARLAIICYASTPCGTCRGHSVRWLHADTRRQGGSQTNVVSMLLRNVVNRSK